MPDVCDSSADVVQPDKPLIAYADHDVNTSILAVSKVTIHDFLTRMGYIDLDCPRDVELEARVKNITQTWSFEKQIHPHIVTGLLITENAYRHLSDVGAKVTIAIFTALATGLDDLYVLDPVASHDFHSRLCSGTIHQDGGIISAYVKVLADMGKYFPQFGAACIISSAIRFINGLIIEGTTGNIPLHASSLPFVEYRRDMSGIPDAYACFIWEGHSFPDASVYMQAIPDAIIYINHTNDILSFYKEELRGEKATYIHDRALATGKALSDTLHEVVNEISSAAQRVRDILGKGTARDAWDNFTMGYIRFHFGDPRYRLLDVRGAKNKYMIEISE